MVRSNVKPIASVGIIIGVIIAVILGLIAYSYTQIQISLDSVEFGGFDWAPSSILTLAKLAFNALTGNVVGLVLSLITGVKLNLVFALSNHGLFPVYIPDLSYNLAVNGNNVGQGHSTVDMTINPGETKTLPILQDFQVSSLEPAAVSVLNAGGMMDIQVSGSAYFKFLGLTISIPFQYTKQVNLIKEAENHFLKGGSQRSGHTSDAYQPPTTVETDINLRASTYSVTEGQTVTFSGRLSDPNSNGVPNQIVYVKRDITLSPDTTLGTAYTDSNGDFTVSWVSTRPMTSNNANVYATFEGSQGYSSARSSDLSINVISNQEIQSTTQGSLPSEQQLQLARQNTQAVQSNPAYSHNPSFQVANSVYQVQAGTYTYIPFNMQCAGTLSGEFSAQAALGDNIIVYIMDPTGFRQFQSGGSAYTYYNSGKVATGTLNVGLASGQYYLVLSNTYSTISTKNVSLAVSYSCS